MRFSAFASFNGGFSFSGRPPLAERIYRANIAAVSKAFDTTPGTYVQATAFARAKAKARAMNALTRAQNQQNPMKAIEMLPELERDWGVIVGEFDSIRTRQKNVAAAESILRGSRLEAVTDALQKLLGSDFIKLRTTPTGELAADMPTSNFARLDLPAKVVRLIDPITVTSGPSYVRYESLNNEKTTIVRGDVLTLDGENDSQTEIVTANTVATPSNIVAPPNSFWADFTKSHDAGTMATTGNFPRWISTQRHVSVVVSASASVDPVKRAKIHRLMSRIMRGVTTWSIVTESGGSIGPLTVGVSPMGTTCIGTVSL